MLQSSVGKPGCGGTVGKHEEAVCALSWDNSFAFLGCGGAAAAPEDISTVSLGKNDGAVLGVTDSSALTHGVDSILAPESLSRKDGTESVSVLSQ